MSSRKIALFTALGLLAILPLLPLQAQPVVGAPFPSLNPSQLEGTVPTTAGKVVLVDFWASWCVPCRASFPALDQLHADYGPRGVVIIGVSIDKKASAYAAFLKKFTPKFATVRDGSHKLVSTVNVPAMPTSVLIGRDGLIRAVFVGYHGAQTEHAIRAALEQTLVENFNP